MIVNDILTVCLITYNHEKYVAQAIDSILIQKTNFNFKIVIADDCSTDNTRFIIEQYQQKYPDKIQVIFQKRNVGPAQNFIDLISYPKSKYIAYLEGDDFWINENKLQIQFNFLEYNKEFSLVHTDVKGLKDSQIIEDVNAKNWNNIKSVSILNDGLRNPIAFSCTSFFVNVGFKKYLDDSYKKIKAGDWGFWIILLCHGKAKYLKDKTAVYRIGTGVSNNNFFYSSSDYKIASIFLLKLFFKLNRKKIQLLIHALIYYKYFIYFKFKEFKLLV